MRRRRRRSKWCCVGRLEKKEERVYMFMVDERLREERKDRVVWTFYTKK